MKGAVTSTIADPGAVVREWHSRLLFQLYAEREMRQPPPALHAAQRSIDTLRARFGEAIPAYKPAEVEQKIARGQFLGMRLVLDEKLPPGVVEVRDPRGVVLSRIEGIT